MTGLAVPDSRPPQADSCDHALADAGTAAATEALRSRRHLAVVAGPDAGWCVALGEHGVVVGRAPGCDLVLDDPLLSRRHVEVRHRSGHVEARDLGSANGTRARPRRVVGVRRRVGARWRRLSPGTRLLVGSSELQVRERPGLAGAPALEALAAGGSRAGRRRPVAADPVLLATTSVLPLALISFTSGAGGWSRLLWLTAVPLVLAGSLLGARGPAREDRAGAGARGVADPATALVLALGAASSPLERPRARIEVRLAGAGLVDPFEDGPLAVVGAPVHVRAVARWVIGASAVALGPGGLDVRAGPDPAWTCCRDLSPTGAREPAVLHVLDLTTRPHPAADPPARPRPEHGALVLVPSLEQLPPWCRRVVEVGGSPPVRVTPAWVVAVARALRTPGRDAPALPSDVRADGLLARPGEAWRGRPDGLRAPVAVTVDGPLEIDLAREGPHALVAGTTGSGKSELLLAWVLALASRYPPSALHVVAVDYKGGATFLPLAGLPHVAGILTDLDGRTTARALAGLRAELVRRERLLAQSGARDLAEHLATTRDPGRRGGPSRGDAPARVLVVVDEFRALADDHPELLAGLVRLAAQGRSLGIHLVLATQRPAGAVTADMRANLSVALCLRVLSATDSLDVLGTPAAAGLPPVPGRLLVAGVPGASGRRPDPGVVEAQSAWFGRDPASVRRAVETVAAAALALGERAAAPLWAPALPERVVSPATAPPGRRERHRAADLPLLLLDRPDERAHAPWSWATGRTALLVAGAPGSGRTTALRTLAAAALERGATLHLAGTPAGVESTLLTEGLAEHPGLGTVVGTDDPRRLARLLDLLPGGDDPAVLCLDDVEEVIAACDLLRGPGTGLERLAALLRAAPSASLGVAVAAPIHAVGSRWAAPARHRLVLSPQDPADAALAGIPRTLVSATWPPGRGVLLGDGPPTLAQVLLPRRPAPGGPSGRAPGPRLAALPVDVPGRGLAVPAGGGHVALGLGGDDATVVTVRLEPGARLVVAGPPESGRTATLRLLADGAERLGRAPTWLGAGEADGRAVPPELEASGVLVVDDADALPRDLADDVAARWRAPGGVVVVAVRSESLAGSFHPLVATLREARRVLVLCPLRGGTAHLPPGEVLPHADPAHPRQPGRGVLVEPHGARAVQVAAPGGP